ncbi:glutamate--tRNA ligase [Cycloclasticus sp.]|jgi:glutamyl-tRNA synthetase|uniref:glutamate--tRNA ligase n=1 Tax=Cycloclasticus TaxID=34067 RepID=UPI00257C5086|nr:glutamate--tRNA ligase [Cycloclasticus sp.]MBV1899537.1 glutamate--tRNA ligase [Cycloclasticus sp.]
MTVRTRFAPSPTGYLHVGGARTALFSWLYAKKTKGQFVLRIEDTDRERSTDESVQAIFDGMKWLGLSHDEGPFFQTERFPRYQEIIEQLLEQGDAYYCYCSAEEVEAMREQQRANKQKPRYNGKCRHRTEAVEGVSPVVRFKNPETGMVVFDDLVRGEISIANDELDDLVIARSDGTPTYNLTVVVDDLDMNMTHVIRGDDHINNTPRQINIMKALGAQEPRFAHVPMILGDDGARLSKRHGAVSVMQYRDDGFLPEALLNYLVRLGWSHGDKELFTQAEMIELFDIKDVNRTASTFNTEKLLWINQQYIINSDPKRLVEPLSEQLVAQGCDVDKGPSIIELVKTQQERAKTLKEMAEKSLMFYNDYEEFDDKAAKKNLKQAGLESLELLLTKFEVLEDWSKEPLHQVILDTAETLDLKLGKVAQPLRVALSGTSVSPALDATLFLLGKEKCLKNIKRGINYIKNRILLQES